MPNTLTNLIPDIYEGLDVVSRELIGFIPAVLRNSTADRVAVGQSLRSPVTPVTTAGDVVVGMAFPVAAYQTIGNKAFIIQKARECSFSWTGTEQYALNSGGPGTGVIIRDQFAQCMRTLANEMETDLALAAYKGASRAYGTAGTPPFASSLADTAQLRKILDDNGAPASDRHLVINTTAGAALRTLTQLTKANEAGDTSLLRQGSLGDIHGFMFRESAKAASVTKGTGASWLVNGTFAIGDTAIAADGGSGTILAGDVITFAGDTNKYVVASALSGGVVTIAEPGLRAAPADNAAITVGNNFAANVGFTRNALLLGTRLPELPDGGDMADDRTIITDDRSGLSFEVSLYRGKRMVTYTVAASWGVLMEKPEHAAVLLG